jgi:hypothetical protein
MQVTKCANCGGALACYSIEWSNLPDSEKCLCSNPTPDNKRDLILHCGELMKALYNAMFPTGRSQ